MALILIFSVTVYSGYAKEPNELERLAVQGNADAQYRLARRSMALVVFDTHNNMTAVEWLAKASEQKHFYARCLLALVSKNDAAKFALSQGLNTKNMVRLYVRERTRRRQRRPKSCGMLSAGCEAWGR